MRLLSALLALGLLLGGCGGDDKSAKVDLPVLDDPFKDVKQMLKDADITICRTDEGTGDISGSYDSISYSIGVPGDPCEEFGGPGYMSLDLYNEPSTAQSQVDDPSSDHYLTWLVDPTTLAGTGETSSPAVLEALKGVFADYPAGGPHL